LAAHAVSENQIALAMLPLPVAVGMLAVPAEPVKIFNQTVLLRSEPGGHTASVGGMYRIALFVSSGVAPAVLRAPCRKYRCPVVSAHRLRGIDPDREQHHYHCHGEPASAARGWAASQDPAQASAATVQPLDAGRSQIDCWSVRRVPL
jgi:hypothetical protein